MTAWLVSYSQGMAGLLAGLIIGSVVGCMLGWDKGRINMLGQLRTIWRCHEQAGLVFGTFPPVSDDPDRTELDNSYAVDPTWGGR